ncbi:helix-turn-helix domain-containing protein [Streptomyces mirabilis]|uniref:helix-turn-helix domain-containing protein n=1 Tax=Streptomyces mirabilis TaxID=68239 RepID=UPI0036854D17
MADRYVRRAPDWLRAHVVNYTGYRLLAAPPQRRLCVPAATVTLFFGWGDPLRLEDVRDREREGRTWEAMAVGLHSHADTSEISGTAHGVQVDLTPLGAYCLGLPLRHLANTVIHPAEILGKTWVAQLTERLALAPDWVGRCVILDEAIAARLALGRTPSPVVLEAWSRLRETRGRVTVSELAQTTGRSRRRLEMLFGEQIGLPPKALARVLRFQSVITLPPVPGRTLAETAAVCGYYDQAHLNHDFHTLTGLTPTQFRRLTTTIAEVPVHGRITSVVID